ncbi:LysR family transcriptional regulator [Roseobacter sp. HKCCD9010]|nr:LysR family transcriptional regulator [Rhodobacterales bacterium HKCCD4356]NNV12482.1 LysR family transcriptional regulator [Roseobacter sp. HKCCD7357]NNV16053.1 LysR family transcriptional regulator [Roseobacter sp. HKCCD8768]NNV25513.1 LysR family transcriptional regulator [Roseobacter sp. HKCCD8192]NNV34415.1 LysR family transcriptional regulator [Roseobacter sp. HKCCD9073]NNV38662.1 LysR family transcriptional regulator [Roseobacter sp. HKCCD9054]NNV42621.1 LysR family transcriptional 
MTDRAPVPCLQRMEFYDLRVMLTVAELGSFRKGSQFLGIGQSAVSRRLQKLEDMLGVSLFERRPAGARLTGAGWQFANRVRPLVQELDEAIQAALAAGSAGRGHLSLGLIASLSQGLIRELSADFIAQHSEVDLSIIEAERGELLTLLSHRRLDVVLASGAFVGDVGDSFVLTREPIHIALPESHRLASQVRLSWSDVRQERFVVSATEPGPEIHDYLIGRLAKLGHTPNVTRHRCCREGIMNLVGLGLGLSLVADHWCGVAYPGVAFRPIGQPDERVPFSLLWRPENDNPALRRFVSLARVHARKAASDGAASQRPDPLP